MLIMNISQYRQVWRYSTVHCILSNTNFGVCLFISLLIFMNQCDVSHSVRMIKRQTKINEVHGGGIAGMNKSISTTLNKSENSQITPNKLDTKEIYVKSPMETESLKFDHLDLNNSLTWLDYTNLYNRSEQLLQKINNSKAWILQQTTKSLYELAKLKQSLNKRDKRETTLFAHHILSPMQTSKQRNYIIKSRNNLHSTAISSASKHSSIHLWRSNLLQLVKSSHDNEILNFVLQFLNRNRVNTDPLMGFYLIQQWELSQLTQYRRIQRERRLKELRIRQEKLRLEEYNRYLNHFANMLAHERVKQVSKASNYHEFKKILLGDKFRYDANDEVTDLVNDSTTSANHDRKLKPAITSGSMNSLRFSNGVNGGIISDIIGSRKSNTRGGRAINSMEDNMKVSTLGLKSVQSVYKSNKSFKHESRIQPLGVMKSGTIYYDKPNRSEDKLRLVFRNYQEFKQVACKPQNVTLCNQALLGLQQQHNTLLIPRGLHIQRCPRPETSRCSSQLLTNGVTDDEFSVEHYLYNNNANIWDKSSRHEYGPAVNLSHYDDQLTDLSVDQFSHQSCDCESPEEECLPLEVSVKIYAVAVMQVAPFENVQHSTELIRLTNHLSCGCQPRCTKRLCMPPLKFIMHTFSDCACACMANDQRCFDLLEGKKEFSKQEMPFPLNGSYILPPCRYGQMNDVHLYHRRCPRRHQNKNFATEN